MFRLPLFWYRIGIVDAAAVLIVFTERVFMWFGAKSFESVLRVRVVFLVDDNGRCSLSNCSFYCFRQIVSLPRFTVSKQQFSLPFVFPIHDRGPKISASSSLKFEKFTSFIISELFAV